MSDKSIFDYLIGLDGDDLFHIMNDVYLFDDTQAKKKHGREHSSVIKHESSIELVNDTDWLAYVSYRDKPITHHKHQKPSGIIIKAKYLAGNIVDLDNSVLLAAIRKHKLKVYLK
jgi:hypothetical protein